ncbi:Mov34/MPN/PAD-1 family protein [Paraburkholderia strydomiana]|uniref:Mov34/MPN/PAD-1 family protein n=1 Tax=Paraburkholderia strydomiana TaxID=1245417 RepID=UPI0038BDB40C
MKWNELPGDVVWLPIAALTSRLGFVDAARIFRVLAAEAPVVLYRPKAAERVLAHAESRSVELGGLLVGKVFSDPAGGRVAAIEICEAVPSEQFDSTAVSLSMGSEVWQQAAAYRKDDLHVVGWYHTHPGLGAFFSGTDRSTQRGFFREPYSLGLVLDPIRNQEAWFIGPESEPVSSPQIARTQT